MQVSSLVTGVSHSRHTLVAAVALVVVLSSCSKLTTKPWTESLDAARSEEKAGDKDKAEDDFQKASAAAEAKFGHYSNQVATCTFELADMYKSTQDYRKAKKALLDLNEIYAKLSPNSDQAEQAKKDLIFVKKKIHKYHLEPPEATAKDKEKDATKESDASKEKDASSVKENQDKNAAEKSDKDSTSKESSKDAAAREEAPAAEKGK